MFIFLVTHFIIERPLSLHGFILPILEDIVTRPGYCNIVKNEQKQRLIILLSAPIPRVVFAYKTFCSIFLISLNVINAKYEIMMNNNANNEQESTNTGSSNNQKRNSFNSILCDFYSIMLKV